MQVVASHWAIIPSFEGPWGHVIIGGDRENKAKVIKIVIPVGNYLGSAKICV